MPRCAFPSRNAVRPVVSSESRMPHPAVSPIRRPIRSPAARLLAAVLPAALLLLPATVGAQAASAGPAPDECFGFSFGQ